MIPADLIKSHHRKSFVSQNLLPLGLGFAAGFVLGYLLRRRRSLPSGPPPIIVKSGSLFVETTGTFTEGADADGSLYTSQDFNVIQGVRVNHHYSLPDGSIRLESFEYENSGGIEVEIQLERERDPGDWADIGRKIKIKSERPGNPSHSRDFKIKIEQRMSRGSAPLPPYTERWEKLKWNNNGGPPPGEFRIKEVEVRRKNGGPVRIFPKKGENDHWEIGFYNELE